MASPPRDAPPICPLCAREITPQARQSDHHLIPRLKGGAHGPRVRLHQICHNAIHANISEAELARRFNTIEALKTHPALVAFIAWVRSKPPAFHARTARPRADRARRRR